MTASSVATLNELLAPVIGASVFVTMWILESLFPLRPRTSARRPRLVVNSVLAASGFVALRVGYLPFVWWLARRNEQWHVGLLQLVPLPAWLAGVVGFLLLDYVAYGWHRLAHRVPLLWRFHVVHHIDRDLDVTTSVRFHFGEILLSMVIRGAGVLLTGATPLTVAVFEITFATAATFHHGNWRLPATLERILGVLIITPPVHGIHHSVAPAEQNSNWGTIFSCWDRLHHTLRRSSAQPALEIGVAEWPGPRSASAWRMLLLPFRSELLRSQRR